MQLLCSGGVKYVKVVALKNAKRWSLFQTLSILQIQLQAVYVVKINICEC